MHTLNSDWSIRFYFTELVLVGQNPTKKFPRKLKLIKKLFQDIFNNKRENKRKTWRTVHFIRIVSLCRASWI